MRTANELLAAALQHHQAGRLPEAEALYRDAVAAEPANVDGWHLLGIIYQQTGKRQDAERCLRRALSLLPDFAEIHFNLGQVLRSDGRLDEAIDCFARAVAQQPDFVDAKHNLAATLNDRALTCRERGSLNEEIEDYRRAIQVNANIAEIHFNLGIASRDLGKIDDAIAAFRRALELDPQIALANAALGLALYKRGDIDEAIRILNKALQQDDTDAATYNNLGLALRLKGRIADAVKCFRRALELNLDRADVHSNLGLALHDSGQLEQAQSSYERALEQDPNLIGAQVGLSTLLLLKGRFETGWPKYEWRWKTEQFVVRDFSRPEWNGESLAGRTILLYAEQGLGDTLQFVRYVPLLKERGAKVVFECQKPLLKLLAGFRGIDHLIAEESVLPAFDFHLPLLSVPRVLNTLLSTIPDNVPYLFAAPQLIAYWRQKLEDLSGFRIGVNWHGRAGHVQAQRRDVPPRYFAALATLPAVQLISLQKERNSDVAVFAPQAIADLGETLDTEHGPFMDTSAIMMNLDLVITSDTSIAHLAGALGVMVWVALPYVPDWRWLLQRTSSPWYPTMRLFRQQRLGEWDAVFDEIRSALNERIQKAERTIQD